MIENLEIYYDNDPEFIRSKVYAINSTSDRFLIVDRNGWFKWVPISDCRALSIFSKKELEDYIQALTLGL